MKNNLLSESLAYSGDSEDPTRLHLHSYNAASVNEAIGETIEDIQPHINKDRINWIKVCGLGNTEAIQGICEYFDINMLVLQDILNVNHPTKIEEYDTHIVVILKRFCFDKENSLDELQQEQLCLILGENYVLTFQEYDTPFFDDVVFAIQNNTEDTGKTERLFYECTSE